MASKHAEIWYWTLTVLLSLAAGLYLASFVGDSPRIALPHTLALRSNNASWETKMDQLNKELDGLEHVLEDIEERDDEVYRQIFGLKDISQESRGCGTGLARRLLGPEFAYGSELERTLDRLDALSGRVALRSEALGQLTAYTKMAAGMADAVPSIPPVDLNPAFVRITSRYGRRTDPVYGDRRMHTGQDFAAKKGYPVYATGDAVVEEAYTQYYGYGREILLNHGYGYKTRYAHLSRMFVGQGDVVKRGQLIGLVGNSGKSTGSHLHYEVIYRGSTVNPRNFMDLSITPQEYRELTTQK